MFNANALKRAASYTKADGGDMRRPPPPPLSRRMGSGMMLLARSTGSHGRGGGVWDLSVQPLFGALLEFVRGFLVEERQEQTLITLAVARRLGGDIQNQLRDLAEALSLLLFHGTAPRRCRGGKLSPPCEESYPARTRSRRPAALPPLRCGFTLFQACPGRRMDGARSSAPGIARVQGPVGRAGPPAVLRIDPRRCCQSLPASPFP